MKGVAKSLLAAAMMVAVIFLFISFLPMIRDKSDGAVGIVSSPLCNGVSKEQFKANLNPLSDINAATYYYQVVELSKTPCVNFGPNDLGLSETRKHNIFCSNVFEDTKLLSVRNYQKSEEDAGKTCI